jgi:hypothetical protein
MASMIARRSSAMPLTGERGNAQRAGRVAPALASRTCCPATMLLPLLLERFSINCRSGHCRMGADRSTTTTVRSASAMALVTALDAKLLDDVLSRANTRRVHKLDRDSLD